MAEKYSLLARHNIWWEGRIEDDVHLSQWREHPGRWVPPQLGEIVLEPFSLNFVVGPRQAGKTTLLKFAIEALLRSGTKPRGILYLRCDEVADGASLRDIVEEFFLRAPEGKTFIFLDEITEVSGWEKTIKGFVDDGDFRHSAVTLSGSNAFQLQKGSELFPGRRGNGRDIFVFPISFREFLRLRDEQLFSAVPQAGGLGEAAEGREFAPLQPRLQKYLLEYFACGGFPLSILSYLKDGRVSESAKDAYRSWLIGDILKAGKSDVLAREILKVIISKAPSPMSWDAIAQETSIRSPPTVQSYVELFERFFALLPLYAANPDTGTREFAKNKKLHIQDPFIWHLAEEWCMQPIAHKTDVIAESALAVHVARFLMRKSGGRRLSDYVSYWKNGSEIDVLAHTGGALVGLEMKWSDREAGFGFKAGPVKDFAYVSKSFFRSERPHVVPLAVFLARL